MPARLVEQADGEGGQVEVVGEETQTAVLLGVVVVDAAERVGVVLARGSRGQHDGVIGAHAGGGVNGVRVAATKQDTALSAGDEEGTAAVEDVQTLEVKLIFYSAKSQPIHY